MKEKNIFYPLQATNLKVLSKYTIYFFILCNYKLACNV
jgi:hypothetical protein